MDNKKHLHIALIMGYDAGKIGALERFLFHFSEEARGRGHKVSIVFIHQPIREVKSTLEKKEARVFIHPCKSRLDFNFIAWLWKWFRKENIDVADCNFDLVNLTGTVTAFLAGVPWRFWHQRNFVSPRLLFLKRFAYRFFNYISHGIICTSSILAEDMIRNGLRKNLVHAIPTGIDPDIYEFAGKKKMEMRKKLGIPEESPVVIMVSQARIEKGCIHLVRASKDILSKYPDTSFLHVGGGPLEENLQQEAEKLGVKKSWLCLGQRSDVPDLLSASDILVLPSYMEGLPNAPLEAQASGLPVVASNVGGVPLAVRDGKTGILIPPRDENKISEAVSSLIENPEIRENMGIEGKKHVREIFSVNIQVKRTLNLYEKIAHG